MAHVAELRDRRAFSELVVYLRAKMAERPRSAWALLAAWCRDVLVDWGDKLSALEVQLARYLEAESLCEEFELDSARIPRRIASVRFQIEEDQQLAADRRRREEEAQQPSVLPGALVLACWMCSRETLDVGSTFLGDVCHRPTFRAGRFTELRTERVAVKDGVASSRLILLEETAD